MFAPRGEIHSGSRGEFEKVGEGGGGAYGVAVAGVGKGGEFLVHDDGAELGEIGRGEAFPIGGDGFGDSKAEGLGGEDGSAFFVVKFALHLEAP